MQNGANPEPKIGRWRAAWYVLMGQRVTPQHIQAEWVEYQQIFNDLLERWSAKLARDARAEKDRIKRLDLPADTQPVSTSRYKSELRRKVAQMRGVGLTHLKPSTEVPNEPQP